MVAAAFPTSPSSTPRCGTFGQSAVGRGRFQMHRSVKRSGPFVALALLLSLLLVMRNDLGYLLDFERKLHSVFVGKKTVNGTPLFW